MHEFDPPIVHCDIRGVGRHCVFPLNYIYPTVPQANILVTDDLRCCLADFGLSAITEMTVTSMRQEGAVAWMAPEIIRGIAEGTSPSPTRDIFAFGRTVLEVRSVRPCRRVPASLTNTGKRPFSGVPTSVNSFRVINGEQPPRPAAVPSHPEIPDGMWAVITFCCQDAPADRPSAEEVLEFLDVPWQNYSFV
jgi:serine/threonine protein kinase